MLATILEPHSCHRVRVLSGSPGLGKSTFALLTACVVAQVQKPTIAKIIKKASHSDAAAPVKGRKAQQKSSAPASNPLLSSLQTQLHQFYKQKKLLPVFLNAFEGEIEQAFRRRLQQACKQAGLKISLSPKLATLEFYAQVLQQISTQGYGGIFIIYDEFGKYLEKGVHNPSALNIQFLQNLAEYCDRSGHKQCHLMLITHLSVSQYANQLPIHVQQEWAKIEGRFQEQAFYDNQADVYKLISSVFQKNIAQTRPLWAKAYAAYIDKFVKNFTVDAFEGFIDLKHIKHYVLNCFPLHPSVLALLPQLSKKVAQNERTLYTFLTRSEDHSLKQFIDKKLTYTHPALFSKGVFKAGALAPTQRLKTTNQLNKKQQSSAHITSLQLMPYDLYQYFSPLVAKDVGIGGAYKIQLVAEHAFGQIDKLDEVSKQIISLLALCEVVKNQHFAPSSVDFILSSFNQTYSSTEVKKSLTNLQNKKIIFYNKHTKTYLLQSGSPIDVDEEIQKLKKVQLTSKALVQVLQRYFKTDFIVPKKYNFEHSITRFYRTELVSVDKLRSLSYKANFYNEDGRVFYVVPFSQQELEVAQKYIQKMNSPLTVFVLPQQFVECKKDIEELNAVDCLYNDKNILNSSPLVKKELDRHKDILLASIEALLKPLIGIGRLEACAYYAGSVEGEGDTARHKQISLFDLASKTSAQNKALLSASTPNDVELNASSIETTSTTSLYTPISSFNQLQRFLGDLFKREYKSYVGLHLEYINCHRVSGSATLGFKKMAEALLQHTTQLNKKDDSTANLKQTKVRSLVPSALTSQQIINLVEGFGPEKAILQALCHMSGLKFKDGKYKLSSKQQFYNFFKNYKKILTQHPEGLKGDELLDALVAPPYGLRIGAVGVFLLVADLCFDEPVNHYFDGAYVKHLDGHHYDLVMKHPKKAKLQYTPVDKKQKQYLEQLYKVFASTSASAANTSASNALSFAAVPARSTDFDTATVSTVVAKILRWRSSIPESTKTSSTLPVEARKMLIQIDSSTKPDDLLFQNIPGCFKASQVATNKSGEGLNKNVNFNQGVKPKNKSIDSPIEFAHKKDNGVLKSINLTNQSLISCIEQAKNQIDRTYPNLLKQLKRHILELAQFIHHQCLGHTSVLGEQSAKAVGLKYTLPDKQFKKSSKKIKASDTRVKISKADTSSSNLPATTAHSTSSSFILQSILSEIKNYSFSQPTQAFINRALDFDTSKPQQYFIETLADVLTGSSPRYWGDKCLAKFMHALKSVQTEVELVCELQSPNFQGQSVVAFMHTAQGDKQFVKLGVHSRLNKKLTARVKKIDTVLSGLDDVDRQKIILALLNKSHKLKSSHKSFQNEERV